MNIEDRPKEMLERQLNAYRAAAKYRNPETGKRHHIHIDLYRPHAVMDMLRMRAALRRTTDKEIQNDQKSV